MINKDAALWSLSLLVASLHKVQNRLADMIADRIVFYTQSRGIGQSPQSAPIVSSDRACAVVTEKTTNIHVRWDARTLLVDLLKVI
jgi:hypothetical protein